MRGEIIGLPMTTRTPLELLKEVFARLGVSDEEPILAGLRGVGERGENLAVEELRKRGYEILERNFRTPIGEIDIVARDGETLCFVEVKWRRDQALGHPAEAVTREKQRRLARTAQWYMARHGEFSTFSRFDVVAILDRPEGAQIEILRDAFAGPFGPRRQKH